MKMYSEGYKSVLPFVEEDLPNLVVLTGLNGSGKTHLLEGLARYNIKLYDNRGQ